MEDKEKVDVGDKELYEKCAEETDTQFKQGYVELCKQNFKALNENEEWEDYADCAENASQEELERLKKENSKFYESCVKLTYYEQLDAQKKKENEQEAVQAAQDEEIVTAIYPYFKVKDNNEDTKRELARRLVGKIRKAWKLGAKEKGNCKGGSSSHHVLNVLIEQDRNKVINLQADGSDLRDVLQQYGLYTAGRQSWDKQIREAERKR